MNRLSIEDLLEVQDSLDNRLVSGTMLREDYEREWREILEASGWTQTEYEFAVDERWNSVVKARTKTIVS